MLSFYITALLIVWLYLQPSGHLDEAFLKSIQDEYATRYLEHMRIAPTRKNKEKMLKKNPLTSCAIQANWSNSGWLADTVSIYPNRTKTDVTYENNRENIVETKNRLERQIRENDKQKVDVWKLEDEESDEEVAAKMRELLGPDAVKVKSTSHVGKAAGEQQIMKQMEMHKANLKKKKQERSKVNNMIEEKKQELIEEAEGEASDEEDQDNPEQKTHKRFELNLDPNYWRKKFLYPFALDPAPLRLDAGK